MSTLFLDTKRIGTQSVVYGVSTALGRTISLITAPILTRIFSPSDYGVISLVQVAIGLAVIFAGMNIGSGIAYYYFYHEDDRTRRNILSSGLVVVGAIGLVMALLFYTFSPQINDLFQVRSIGTGGLDLTPYLKIGSYGLFFGVIMTTMQTILRINQQPRKYFLVEATALLTTLAFMLTLVVWHRVGIEGVFWSRVGGYFLGMLVGIWFVRAKLGAHISLTLLIPIVTYSLPQLPGVIINWVQSQAGRLFINYYATMTEQGLYSIAFTLASVLVMVTSAFRLAYGPYALSIMKKNEAKKTYANFFSIYAFAFGAMLGLIVGLAKPVVMILAPPEYHSAHVMVFWLAAGAFLMGAGNILGTGIWIKRRTIMSSYAQVITLCVVIFASFILVPRFQGDGAAAAFFLGSVAQAFAYYYFAQRLFFIPYRFLQVQMMLLCLVLIGWMNSQLVLDAVLFDSFAIGLFCFVLSVIVAFMFAFSGQQRSHIACLAATKILAYRGRKS